MPKNVRRASFFVPSARDLAWIIPLLKSLKDSSYALGDYSIPVLRNDGNPGLYMSLYFRIPIETDHIKKPNEKWLISRLFNTLKFLEAEGIEIMEVPVVQDFTETWELECRHGWVKVLFENGEYQILDASVEEVESHRKGPA